MIFSFLAFLAGSVVATIKFSRCRVEQGPLLTISILGCLLYFFGLIDHAKIGVVGLFGVGMSFFFWSLLEAYRGKAETTRLLLSPVLVIFLGVTFLLWIRLRGWEYIHWDEFSHWALALKNLVYTDTLPIVDGPMKYVDYPPMTTLLEYFVCKILGHSPRAAYLATGITIIAALLVWIPCQSWAQWPEVSALIIIQYLLLHVLGHGFANLMVDHVLAVIAAAAILIYFHSQTGRYHILLLAPVLVYLTLTKTIGAFLSYTVIAVVLLDYVVRRRVRSLSSLAALVIFVLIPIVTVHSWSRYLDSRGIVAEYLEPTPPVKDIALSFLPSENSERHQTTIGNFIRAVIKTPVYGSRALQRIFDKSPIPLSPAFWVLVILGFVTGTLYFLRDPLERKAVVSCHLILIGAFVFYLLGMLVMFLHHFREVEGVGLYGADRYFGIFLLLWIIVAFVQWYEVVVPRQRWRVIGISLVFLVLSAPVRAEEFIFAPPPKSPSYLALAENIGRRLPHAARVYGIWIGSFGWERHIFQLGVFPVRVNQKCWSVRTRPPDSSADTSCLVSPTEWAGMLSNYQYVFIGRTDAQFWKDFGSFFEIYAEDSLYQVVRRDGKKPHLVLMASSD